VTFESSLFINLNSELEIFKKIDEVKVGFQRLLNFWSLAFLKKIVKPKK